MERAANATKPANPDLAYLLEDDRADPLDQDVVLQMPAHRLGQHSALHLSADPDHIVYAVLV